MPLPDYLEPQLEDAIRQRMLDRLPATRDKSEGSFSWDPIMALAIELGIVDDRLRYVFDLGFAATTFGEFLDRKAEEHGLTRRVAVSATGEVTFTGADTTVIPAGTEVSTVDVEGAPAQSFTTDAEVVISGTTATAAVTATTGGVAGNVGAGAIQVVVTTGLDVTVTNADPTTGGLDEETDPELLVRIETRVRNPSASGNIADYINWSLERSGVGGAAVVPLEDGPGTVTVALIDTDKQPADSTIVDDVQEYIAPGGSNAGTGQAPIGATVTVEAATPVTINFAANITYEAGFVEADVNDAIEASLVEYLKEIAFADDNDVRHARVVTAIVDTPGVTDATSVTINAGTSNIAIAVKEVAVAGTYTWT